MKNANPYALKNSSGKYYKGWASGAVALTDNVNEAARFAHPREIGDEKRLMSPHLNNFTVEEIGDQKAARIGRIVIHGDFIPKDWEKVTHLWDGSPRMHRRYNKAIHLPIQTVVGKLAGNNFYPDKNGDKVAILCNSTQVLLPFRSKGVYSSHKDNVRTYEILIVPCGTERIHCE